MHSLSLVLYPSLIIERRKVGLTDHWYLLPPLILNCAETKSFSSGVSMVTILESSVLQIVCRYKKYTKFPCYRAEKDPKPKSYLQFCRCIYSFHFNLKVSCFKCVSYPLSKTALFSTRVLEYNPEFS